MKSSFLVAHITVAILVPVVIGCLIERAHDRRVTGVFLQRSARDIGPAFGLVVGFHLTPLSAP